MPITRTPRRTGSSCPVTRPLAAIFLLGLLAAAGAGRDTPQAVPDKALSREYTSRLSSPVVVYETDRFRIIASKSYDKEVSREIVPNVEKATAEFCTLFGVEPGASLWSGKEKGRLVLLKTRKVYRNYLELFEEEAQPDRLHPSFVEAVQDAQSFYWIEPLPYAVCCGEGAGIEELAQHLFHLLGHILITHYDYNHKFTPPWLHEGFGTYLAVRYAGGNILFCTQGLNHCLFGTGVFKGLSAWARSENWPEFMRLKRYRESLLHLYQLGSLDLPEFGHPDAAQAWSFVTYLITKHPQGLRAYLKALKEQPRELGAESFWPPYEFTADTFREAFGKGLEEMEPHWIAWTETFEPDTVSDHGKDRRPRENPTAAETVAFDPAFHLEGFIRFENESVGEALAPFLKRTGDSMSPEEMEEIRAAWESTRKELVTLLERNKMDLLTRQFTGLEKVLAEAIASDESRDLTVEEITDLCWPNLSPHVFRSVTRYLVDRFGCYGAQVRLAACFDGAWELLEGKEIKNDMALLEEASHFEAELFRGLAAAGVSLKLDLWPARLKLGEAAEGMMTLSGKKGSPESFSPPFGPAPCRIEVKGKDVEIRCPWSCLPLKSLLSLGKTALKQKSDEDRLGYLQLCLFRGDEDAFKKELKQIKVPGDGTEKCNSLMPLYREACIGAALLELLSGGLSRNPDEGLNRLGTLVDPLNGSELNETLEVRRMTIVRRVLLEDLVDENRFLRSFRGFQGVEEESGAARFVYDFKEGAELEDFDPLPDRVLTALKHRFKADTGIRMVPFQMEGGCLSCVGLDAFMLRPVFTGDMSLKVCFRFNRTDDAEGGAICTLIGYGLDKDGAYVASSCLTHLEIKIPTARKIEVEKIPGTDDALEPGREYTLRLEGKADRIIHDLNETQNWTHEVEGQRTGRVFIWVYGPWRFEIDRVEVTGKIEPVWLWDAIIHQVETRLENLKNQGR